MRPVPTGAPAALTRRGRAGVGHRGFLPKLCHQLFPSKNVRLSPAAAHTRIQVFQRSGRPSAPNPAPIPWRVELGWLWPQPSGWRPKRRCCKPGPASSTLKAAAGARGAARGRAARRREWFYRRRRAHQPGAGWQEPRRGWPERVAARRRERRVAASSWAQLLGGGCGGGGFPPVPRCQKSLVPGAGRARERCRPQLLCLELCVCKGFPGQSEAGEAAWQQAPEGILLVMEEEGSRRRGCRGRSAPHLPPPKMGGFGARRRDKRGAFLPGTGSSISGPPPPSLGQLRSRAAETPPEPGAVNSAEHRAGLRAAAVKVSFPWPQGACCPETLPRAWAANARPPRTSRGPQAENSSREIEGRGEQD